MTDTWRFVVCLLALGVIVEGVGLAALMRQVGGILLRGAPGGAVSVGGPELGSVQRIPGLEDSGRPAMVVFVSTACQQCKELIPKLRQIHAAYGEGAPEGHQFDLVAILTDRNLSEREALAAELGSFARTDLVGLMQDWQVPGTPFAVGLDGKGRVRVAAGAFSQMQLEMLAVERLGVLLVPDDRRPLVPSVVAVRHVASTHQTAEVAR